MNEVEDEEELKKKLDRKKRREEQLIRREERKKRREERARLKKERKQNRIFKNKPMIDLTIADTDDNDEEMDTTYLNELSGCCLSIIYGYLFLSIEILFVIFFISPQWNLHQSIRIPAITNNGSIQYKNFFSNFKGNVKESTMQIQLLRSKSITKEDLTVYVITDSTFYSFSGSKRTFTNPIPYNFTFKKGNDKSQKVEILDMKSDSLSGIQTSMKFVTNNLDKFVSINLYLFTDNEKTENVIKSAKLIVGLILALTIIYFLTAKQYRTDVMSYYFTLLLGGFTLIAINPIEYFSANEFSPNVNAALEEVLLLIFHYFLIISVNSLRPLDPTVHFRFCALLAIYMVFAAGVMVTGSIRQGIYFIIAQVFFFNTLVCSAVISYKSYKENQDQTRLHAFYTSTNLVVFAISIMSKLLLKKSGIRPSSTFISTSCGAVIVLCLCVLAQTKTSEYLDVNETDEVGEMDEVLSDI